jgi:hypothetical protein
MLVSPFQLDIIPRPAAMQPRRQFKFLFFYDPAPGLPGRYHSQVFPFTTSFLDVTLQAVSRVMVTLPL